MADLSDVERALVALINSAIYPDGFDGDGLPNTPSKILLASQPVPCAVFRGWPMPTSLAEDLKAGTQNISVFTPPQSMRNTSRHPPDWVDLATPDATIAIVVAGNTFTVTGNIQTPQNIALRVNNKTYLYAIQENDDLAAIAAALAAAINADTHATVSGAVVTVTAAFSISAQVGLAGTVQRVLRQQEQMFDVGIWCGSPELRDAVAAFIDGALAGAGEANPRSFMAMPDGSVARLIYRGTRIFDVAQTQGVFRRDLVFTVDYATTETIAATPIVDGQVNITS